MGSDAPRWRQTAMTDTFQSHQDQLADIISRDATRPRVAGVNRSNRHYPTISPGPHGNIGALRADTSFPAQLAAKNRP